jgi:hypothetical protein
VQNGKTIPTQIMCTAFARRARAKMLSYITISAGLSYNAAFYMERC